MWISATDLNFAQIADLVPADFRGEYHRKPVKILDVSHSNQRHRVVLLLDASGSLGKSDAAPEVWLLSTALASDFAEAKLPNTDLALIIFNDKIVEKMDFAAGQEKIAGRLRQIASDKNYEKTTVKGKTALWDAVGAALEVIGQASDGVIYTITDGGDNASQTKPADLKRRLSLQHARLFVSLVAKGRLQGQPLFISPEELQSATETVELAEETGGTVLGPMAETAWGAGFTGTAVNPDRKITMRAALSNFSQSMLNGYHLEIELPEPPRDWSSWKLDMAKSVQAQHKYAKLTFARALPPCKK